MSFIESGSSNRPIAKTPLPSTPQTKPTFKESVKQVIQQAAHDVAGFFESGQAQATLDLDKYQAQADIAVKLEDLDGLNELSQKDIRGQLQGVVGIGQDVFFAPLLDLKGKSFGGAKVKNVSFSAKEEAYVIRLEAEKAWGLIWDNFDVKIKANDQGQLYLQIDDNWFPDSSIISRIEGALRKSVQQQINKDGGVVELDLKMERKGDKLYLNPIVNKIDIPLNKDNTIRVQDMQQALGRFDITPEGDLKINFDNVKFTGSSDPKGKVAKPDNKADRADLKITAKAPPGKPHEIKVKGSISLHLDSQEATSVAFGGESLTKQGISQANLEANIDSTLLIDDDLDVQVKANNKWRLDDVVIEGKSHDIVSNNIEVNLDTRQGLKIQVNPTTSSSLFVPDLTPNTIEPIINGPAYDKEMKTAIRNAEESISLESFLYYDGEKTRELTRLLALKAAGLREGPSRLRYDPKASSGIPVHVLVNHKLNKAGAEKVAKMFREEMAKLDAEIDRLPIDDAAKKDYHHRLQKNLKWGALTDGVAKADHRKVLIIDGKTGYTGGVNMGDHFLKEDSYHDIMLKMNGPAVGNMMAEYAANWKSFTGQDETFNIKSKAELVKHQKHYTQQTGVKPSQVDVVTTDDKSTDIEAALLSTIRNAKKEIHIEHAYYSHRPVQEALLDALKRGVTIDIVVPKNSDEELFDIVNLDMIRELMEAQQKHGKGKVNAWLYTGTPGKASFRSHTKALSADGQYAIIGSANLIPRALNSAFQEVLPNGEKVQILYNEEMSLYIDDPARVGEINEKLFIKDREKSESVDLKAVKKRIQDLGGEKALQVAKIKANLA